VFPRGHEWDIEFKNGTSSLRTYISVTRAWLDHIALVTSPAYDGAKVLAVLATPRLDALRNDPTMV
jgi:hypothetical protein